MFKLMDKQIIAISRELFLLNWPYEVCSVLIRPRMTKFTAILYRA